MRRRLRIPNSLKDFVAHLPPPLKGKLRAGLEAVLEDPLEGKPLQGDLEGLWNLRIGHFRIIYRQAANGVIEVIAIGPRKSIYLEVSRLLRRDK